ncbi:MAG: endonuclease III [Bacteroidales bacterium]|nr:endonuclease III [Bacteroidales bacterium]
MTKAERYRQVLDYFEKNVPAPESELKFADPYQLIVAVILSAQCTDKRVNMITPAFFRSYPDPFSLAGADSNSVFEHIKSCSYPNNKTKNLIGMAQVLIEKFNGIVPADMESLQMLPGVGRKTANVIASVAFNIPAMAVDTHVFRVSSRIGLTTAAKNPLQAEKQLVKHIPLQMLSKAHHWLILHGRYVCKARNPACEECGLKKFCRYYASKA